nr:putative reverse transcriptase domain-containing protein [Tanacetum cinerariifolium]
QKDVKFDWDDKQEATFQQIKQKLCSAPMLTLPEGSEDFVVYCDASIQGLGAVLMQREKKISNMPVPIPDHPCLIGLILPHGNNAFDYTVGKKRMGGLLSLLHSGLPFPFSSGLAEQLRSGLSLAAVCYRFFEDLSQGLLGIKPLSTFVRGSGLV